MAIHKDVPIINIVVFGQKATLKDVESDEKHVVIKKNQLIDFIVKKEKELSHTMNLDVMQKHIEDLFFYNNTNTKDRKAHVKRIKEKYQM